MKINVKELNITVILMLLFLQRPITIVVPIFSYFDELLSVVFISGIVLKFLVNGKKIKRLDRFSIYLLILLVLVGILGNIYSKVLTNFFAICVDILSTVKVISAFYFFKFISISTNNIDNIINNLVKFTKAYVVIMAAFYVLSLVVDTGMMSQIRYGIPSFGFIFYNPGNLSKAFYFIMIFLIINLREKNLSSIIYLILSLLLWATTLRTRAFAFIAIFLAVYGFVILMKKRLDIKRILLVGVLGIVIAFEQIVFYFTTEGQVRNLLLEYGVVTMKKYFPLGSGFGTYGSDIAAEYYSKLYREYGFSSVYGFTPDDPKYANDNFWPMIMGQFGILGIVIFVFVLLAITIPLLNKCVENKYIYLAVVSSSVFLAASSLASKSYVEFTSICIFAIYGLIYNKFARANKEVNIINQHKYNK